MFHGTLLIASARRHTLALMLAMLSSAGCGYEMARVSGTVTLEGEAVGPGAVIFLPDGTGEKVPTAIGHFGVDGRYRLGSNSPDDGARIGEYRVIIQGRGAEDQTYGEETAGTPSLIPLLYADPASSGLTAHVSRGENTIDFDLRN